MKRRIFWGTLSILIMALIYYFSADNAAASNQKSDSVFTLLYPLVSAWLSEDQLVFAVRKGAHFLIPFSTREANGKFYEFKVEKAKKPKQKGKGQYMTLLVGLGFLMIAIALTVAWYYV